jgi:hypothetical protein
MLLPLQVKGAEFSQHSALQQIEAMCRLHRPEQKPAVSITCTLCKAWEPLPELLLRNVAVHALHTADLAAAAAEQVQQLNHVCSH